MESSQIRVGLLGCGHVGTALVSLIAERRDEVARRTGLYLDVTRIAVRNTAIDRGVGVDASAFTTDATAVVADADVDVVVEVMGGIEPAREHILSAIGSGADVITANKALLATHGPEIFEAADRVGASVYYEAAAAGAIPIIRPLRDSLAGRFEVNSISTIDLIDFRPYFHGVISRIGAPFCFGRGLP